MLTEDIFDTDHKLNPKKHHHALAVKLETLNGQKREMMADLGKLYQNIQYDGDMSVNEPDKYLIDHYTRIEYAVKPFWVRNTSQHLKLMQRTGKKFAKLRSRMTRLRASVKQAADELLKYNMGADSDI